jgi:hypothetical protein
LPHLRYEDGTILVRLAWVGWTYPSGFNPFI